MITLKEAFALCNINDDEFVYLKNIEAKYFQDDGYCYRGKTIREKLDMKKIKVHKIDLVFEHFGYNFKGIQFIITGVSSEELYKHSLFY